MYCLLCSFQIIYFLCRAQKTLHFHKLENRCMKYERNSFILNILIQNTNDQQPDHILLYNKRTSFITILKLFKKLSLYQITLKNLSCLEEPLIDFGCQNIRAGKFLLKMMFPFTMLHKAT